MQLEVGEILEGKVNGITKFGAFVTLPDGKSGLVHISEISNTYVNDIREHVTEGQTVRVKILNISDDGKINLSIKKAVEQTSSEQKSTPRPAQRSSSPRPQRQYGPAHRQTAEVSADSSFEDKLKQFMQESDSRISGNRLYADRKTGSRRKRD